MTSLIIFGIILIIVSVLIFYSLYENRQNYDRDEKILLPMCTFFVGVVVVISVVFVACCWAFRCFWGYVYRV